ncbi:MAG: 50S ribosomal protein L22 [Candidatus Parvarchaeota archaeon]|nr:50S ribosomal protein L22 [Candidatus Jingweiarchaeum tengchongense]MCW1297800.1 50S ribosomal protein L22 [Candidatus Jingweiarchaeum tengchongense]MCW1299810.1 50S ribosomal protein L22 [Candidatus Jingweiarchaeum tengchongense]MCW1304219.1 50S ribosomal protein L22 [Candidatus Jingweiarchaeum tengchongense]MCW1305247.1 50S ribosomal protein L22 [Candidatus Jingweiarchaeum tengchongense]
MAEEKKEEKKEKKEVKVVKGKLEVASARGWRLPISFKKCVNIAMMIKGKDVSKAKKILEEVLEFKRAVPFKRYKRDVPHRKGIAAGRYATKPTKYMLELLKNAIANAKYHNMDEGKLYISKILVTRGISKKKMQKYGYGKGTNVLIELSEKK